MGQYTYIYVSIELSKNFMEDAQIMKKVTKNGKAEAGKSHPILTDRYLGTYQKKKVQSVIIAPFE